MSQRVLLFLLVVVMWAMSWFGGLGAETAVFSSPPTRRINVPYWQIKPPHPHATQPAISWLGQVDNTSNYADVRTIFDDETLYITIHVIDRYLWYDTSPSPAQLANWDAVTLYLNLPGNMGHSPDTSAYQFVAQLNHWQARDSYQTAYQGDGTGWLPSSISFTTSTGWRGVTLNDNAYNARGWLIQFAIPFASLELPAAPSQGTVWGLAIAVHDRDDAIGSPISDSVWPETMSANVPASWGQIHFGLPLIGAPHGLPTDSVTIRHGLNGAEVPDGHVGGHTVCGSAHHPDYFPTWGSANYAGYGQINVQNQWDIADWPCFSKYFVTFPLQPAPANRTLLNATLIMHQFGSAWGNEVESSWIQVLTVHDDWDEASLTWNNAPLAGENLTGAWVEPIGFPGWPGKPNTWNVTKAVAEAYASGTPLRLALYSADGAYHSGRYFSSSEAADWNATARPTLRIEWGEPCGADGVRCVYLPTVRR